VRPKRVVPQAVPRSPDWGPETPPQIGQSTRCPVRRQVQSLDWLRVPLRFWWMGAMSPERATRRSRETEWPRIRADIDAGRL
jgi:hypothetical protein